MFFNKNTILIIEKIGRSCDKFSSQTLAWRKVKIYTNQFWNGMLYQLYHK